MASSNVDPRASRRYWVPWDWTDVLLLIVGTIAIVMLVAAPALVGALELARRHGLSKQAANSALQIGLLAALDVPAVGLAAYLALHRRRASRAQLGWSLPRARWFWLAPVLAFGCLVLSVPLEWLNQRLLPGQTSTQCHEIKTTFGSAYALAIPMVCLLVPFAEETVFRGFLFGWLRRSLPLWASSIVAAALFAAAHQQNGIVLPLFGVGMVLVLTYHASGSLYPGMLTHGLFNFVGLIAILGSSGC